MREGTPVLIRQPGIEFIDDKAGKPVAIHNRIGRRPFDKGWDEAVARGWTVVSMKHDWKAVFPAVK